MSDTDFTAPPGDNDVYLLPARLDTAAAETLHADLGRRTGRPLTLDAHRVELLGARCLDVLLNARHHWAAAGHEVAFTGASAACAADLRVYGLTPGALSTGGRP